MGRRASAGPGTREFAVDGMTRQDAGLQGTGTSLTPNVAEESKGVAEWQNPPLRKYKSIRRW